MRSAVPVLMIVVAAASLAAIAYPTVPQYATTTNSSILTTAEIHPEVLIDYSYSNVTCFATPSVSCYVLVLPYTATETWSGQFTETMVVLLASTNYVPYAFSGLAGAFALLIVLVVLAVGVIMITRKR